MSMWQILVSIRENKTKNKVLYIAFIKKATQKSSLQKQIQNLISEY